MTQTGLGAAGQRRHNMQLVRHDEQRAARRNTQKSTQARGVWLVLRHTFRLKLFLGHQIHRGRHGHGGHAEASRQRFHGARHHAEPHPSLACPKPLAPRRRASKRLVIPTLQGQGGEEQGSDDRPLSQHVFDQSSSLSGHLL